MNKKDEEDNPVTEDSKDDDKNEVEKVEVGVGETLEYDGMSITLKSVRYASGGGFYTPSKDKFIIVDLAMENNSKDERIVSTFFNVDLEDDDGYKYKSMLALDSVERNIDGSMTAGGKLTGEIPFDVSESGFYNFTYTDPLKSGKAVWTIKEDSILPLK